MADTNWESTQAMLLQRWPGLDEKALRDTKGDREGILALLEGRLGYARANAERDYDELLAGESSVAKDIADDKQHTGTSGPVGDAHGSLDAHGKERADTHVMENARGEVQRPSTIPGTPVGSREAITDAKLAEEYAEGDQGAAAALESDNSDGKTVPPDMQKDEGTEQVRRAS